MGLFLLGIPLGIAGIYSLAKDTSHVARDNRIENANRSIKVQKRQIDKHFVDILKYCNADCDINSFGEISNVKKGRYGGMEIYLTKKGYKTEAIEYCKKKFDNIAKNEKRQHINKIKKEIDEFEKALETEEQIDITLTINRYENKTDEQVQKEINKLIKYFHTHGNDVTVNIIMGGTEPHHNHTEIWLIKEPIGYNSLHYFYNVCDVLGIK